jgi:AhpD family alkylhydroperoxidase
MRLAVLDNGHRFATKALFAIIRAASCHPAPEALKLVMYRPEFYGTPMQKITQDAMRGPSAWSVGDRELMAALISKMNACEYCVKAHTAVSAKAYRDPAKVSAALADLETAPLDEPLRATLRMLA